LGRWLLRGSGWTSLQESNFVGCLAMLLLPGCGWNRGRSKCASCSASVCLVWSKSKWKVKLWRLAITLLPDFGWSQNQ
jgi:hypothetical protein